MRRLLAALAGVLCLAAADPQEALPDAAAEARAQNLFREVRCVVCQNESIADSDAEIARDLRVFVREQVAAGRTDREVKAYLVDRYGEFVLLRPTLSASNALLWAAPFAVVLGGAAWLLLSARLRREPAAAPLSPEEKARLDALTNGDG